MTRWRCWRSSPGRARRSGTPPRRTRWACWRWWRGRTSEPAGSRTGRTGGGGSPGKVAPDRVISTVDREARHTRKCKSKRRDGFRGHVAAEPETGLITDCEMTMAAGAGQHGRGERRQDGLPATGFMVTVRVPVTAGMTLPAPGRARMPALRRRSRGRARPPGRSLKRIRNRDLSLSRNRSGRARVSKAGRMTWRFTAIPPTAAGRPAPPTATPGMTPSYEVSAAPLPPRQPSTTSPLARSHRTAPPRPGSPGR